MPEMKGQESIVIPAPIDRVYDYVSDFPRHIEWNHQPSKMIQITEGSIGVGTRFHTYEQAASTQNWFMANILFPIMQKIFGIKPYTEAEITALVPNEAVRWKASASDRNGISIESAWEITLEEVDGGTKLTQTFHYIPRNPMTERMANDSMQKGIALEVAHNLERLKAIMTA